MIYLRLTTDPQMMTVPKNGDVGDEHMSLILRDTTDLQGVTLDVNGINASDIYFFLAVLLPENISSGEHQYQLMRGDDLVSCGLLFIGDETSRYHQHEVTTTYTQYEQL